MTISHQITTTPIKSATATLFAVLLKTLLNTPIKALLISLPLALSPPLFAQTEAFQSINAIELAAKDFLQERSDRQKRHNTKITIDSIDTRLTLSACDSMLKVFLPPGSKMQGKTTVGVRCHSPRPWTLYVPATITTLRQILVAKTSLRRGHIVSADDIAIETRDAGQLNARYISSEQQVIGKVLKRNLANRAVFTASILTEPNLIQKGQQVDLQAGSNGIKVNVAATALSSGAVGEKIRVQNLSSKKIVEGIVLSSGTVEAN